jgi:hypothetical protein
MCQVAQGVLSKDIGDVNHLRVIDRSRLRPIVGVRKLR